MDVISQDGEKLYLNVWDSLESEAKGVVQIIHGMAEYGQRYELFAKKLNELGYKVIALDHRGHGVTGFKYGVPGYFSDKDGWNKVVEDNYIVYEKFKGDYPYFMIGHSMGSFILRTIVNIYNVDVEGCIFSGSGNPSGIQISMGNLFSSFLKCFSSPKKESRIMNKIMFLGFNKGFENYKDEFAWLSKDKFEVKKYVEDPWCGFVPTLGFFDDFLNGIIKLYDLERELECSKYKMLWVFGSEDPVSRKGKDIIKLKKKYGFKNSKYKIYKDSRHEVLMDLLKDDVFEDIKLFLSEG